MEFLSAYVARYLQCASPSILSPTEILQSPSKTFHNLFYIPHCCYEFFCNDSKQETTAYDIKSSIYPEGLQGSCNIRKLL